MASEAIIRLSEEEIRDTVPDLQGVTTATLSGPATINWNSIQII
jgi:hypothetical protein